MSLRDPSGALDRRPVPLAGSFPVRTNSGPACKTGWRHAWVAVRSILAAALRWPLLPLSAAAGQLGLKQLARGPLAQTPLVQTRPTWEPGSSAGLGPESWARAEQDALGPQPQERAGKAPVERARPA